MALTPNCNLEKSIAVRLPSRWSKLLPFGFRYLGEGNDSYAFHDGQTAMHVYHNCPTDIVERYVAVTNELASTFANDESLEHAAIRINPVTGFGVRTFKLCGKIIEAPYTFAPYIASPRIDGRRSPLAISEAYAKRVGDLIQQKTGYEFWITPGNLRVVSHEGEQKTVIVTDLSGQVRKHFREWSFPRTREVEAASRVA